MKNNSDDKEMMKIFYNLYYICMKYNDEKNLYKKDKEDKEDKKYKKENDCSMYFHGYKFFVEKYINDRN